ncbi:mechanosensitive ion channel family protein [Sandarakinorhabdus sp.]|uniref:mechanosensitive ion channel family protein n=1 Tax=Sandarakinorhabdus sp. TaxID=1916663 RepID=UPI003F6F1FB5
MLDPIGRAADKLDNVLGETWRWLTQDSGEALFGAGVGIVVYVVLELVLLSLRRVFPVASLGWRGLVRSIVDRTLELFLFAVALDAAANVAAPPGPLLRLVDNIFIVAMAVQVALWLRELVLGLIRSRASGDAEDSIALGSAMGVITVLVNVVVWLLVGILILDNLGVNVTALVAGLGVGGIAIGLAAQGIFSDLFAALAILFDRPFRVGDTISYGGSIGSVEHIGLKTTRIRSLSGEQLVMANTKLLEQQVANLRRIEERRVVMTLGIIYQTPPDVLEALPGNLQAIVDAQDNCRFDRAHFTGFGASSLDFELVFFTTVPEHIVFMNVRQAVGFAIVRRFAELGVEFAYPTQTSFTAAPDGRMIDPTFFTEKRITAD